MIHFGLTTRDRAPVKLRRKETTPRGALARSFSNAFQGELKNTYKCAAVEIALQCQTFCHSAVYTLNTVVHQKNGSSAVKKSTVKFGRNHVRGGIAARSAGMIVS